MELGDIRREYSVVLARLQLSVDFPELTRSSQSFLLSFPNEALYSLASQCTTDVSLDPESVIALFSQMGEFDSAFSFAAAQTQVDMSSLFENLTANCVSLGLNGVK